MTLVFNISKKRNSAAASKHRAQDVVIDRGNVQIQPRSPRCLRTARRYDCHNCLAVGEALHVEQAQKISQKTIAELTNYELMVRGLQHLHRINYEDNQIARDLFEQVRIREPEQYFPILCFVWTYAIELQYGWPSSEVDALDPCRDLTHQLLRRHDRSAQLHRIMSRLFLLSGNHDQALAHIERAYQLNP